LNLCSDCGAPNGAADLMCSQCGALTHAAELEQLASQAKAAQAKHDWTSARDLWNRCLTLLPPTTQQYKAVQTRAAECDSRTRGVWAKIAAWAGPGALIVWKFKTVLLVVLTKGKLLFLGLTKAGTLLSMLAWVGVYWALYGWPFAIGSVLSIYVHEMGHVVALKRFGIPAGAPMFIPGFGAFIRLRQLHLDRVEDSRVGLAGPLYGLGAALTCYAVYTVTGWHAWRAIAHFGAFINLFNLIPVWQLDGARGWRSLAQNQRVIVTATAGILWFVFSEPILFVIALACGIRLFWPKDPADTPDQVGVLQFGGIMTALAILGWLARGLAETM
jgi:Zn-dependent protease